MLLRHFTYFTVTQDMPLSISIVIYLYPCHANLYTYQSQTHLQFLRDFVRFSTMLLTASVGITQVMHHASPRPVINAVTSVKWSWFVSSCMTWPPTPDGGKSDFKNSECMENNKNTPREYKVKHVEHIACKILQNIWKRISCRFEGLVWL